MGKMEVGIFLLVIGLLNQAMADFVPSHLLKSLTTDGLPVLKSELEDSVKDYETYQDKVVVAQSECRILMEPNKDGCSTCIRNKCEAKILELNCGDIESPNWRERLRTTFINMREDINGFFEEKFPKLTQISKDVKAFFSRITKKIGEKIKAAYESVKNFFGNTFGRRKRSPERLEPPSSCEDFKGEEKMLSSCEYFSKECSICRPTTADVLQNCPKVATLLEDGRIFSWLHSALTYDGSDFYNVESLHYQHGSSAEIVDNVQVSVTLFGEDISFPLDGRHFNPNKVKDAAPVIVKEAINWYRKNFEEDGVHDLEVEDVNN